MSNIFRFIKQIPRPIWLAVLSGILVGTSYIPFPGWALLFCYSPLWIAALELHLQNASLKKIFFIGWLTQFILTLIGFNWIYYVSSEFGQLPWFLSLGALLLFAGAMHIYIPFSLIFSSWILRRQKIYSRFIQLCIFALSFSFFERLWPSIFEWNLAYSLLWMKSPLSQWADTVGFWGLSTWILLAQAILTFCFLIRKSENKKAVSLVVSLVIIIFILTRVGIYKEETWSKTDTTIQFGIAQGNIGNAEKILSEKKEHFQSYILDVYSELTETHLKKNPKTELMLWPETALPFALDSYYQQRLLQHSLLEKVQIWNLTLLTGGYSQSQTKKDHLGNHLTRNSVFFIGPHLQMQEEPYHKTALLVFGEYMPLGKQFPFLYELLPFVGVYERGPGPSPKRVELRDNKHVILGPQICYESLDSAFSRELAKNGADILFNVTNDSWFGWWAEPFQHNIMTLARALEVRRPLVRATNTGISSAILANGQQLETSPIDKPWAHTYEIPYLTNAPQTFYTTLGHWDWLLWLIVFMALILKGKYVRD